MFGACIVCLTFDVWFRVPIVLWVAGITVSYLVFDLLAFVVGFGMVGG